MGGFWRRSPQQETEIRLGIEITSKSTYPDNFRFNKWYVRKPRSIVLYLLFPWLQIGYHGKRQPDEPNIKSNPNRPIPPKTTENPYVLRKDYKGALTNTNTDEEFKQKVKEANEYAEMITEGK